MPLGFSGAKDLIAMGERYGVRRAQQIEQDGLKIEGALQKVTANRQIQGLGQTLSQLDPQTPDYTQKLMEIAPQFPEAMRDPRGQALFSMGVMANKQWEQRQAQTEQANRTLANQQNMQGLRHRDAITQIAARNQGRTTQEVDLLNVPQRLTPQNPATGIMTGGMSAPMTSAQNANAPDETAQLGMSGDQDSISERALTPLRDAQQMTGVKPNRAQVFSAIAGERTREQQQKLLDDRQAETTKNSDKKAAADKAEDEAKTATRAAADEKKALASNAEALRREDRFERSQQRLLLQNQISTIDREITQHRRALTKHEESGGSKNADFFARKKELQGFLEEAGKEQTRIKKSLSGLGENGEEEVFKTEAEAIAAGRQVGDVILLINPKTGKPAKARLE